MWSHFHTQLTVNCASWGRSFRKEGWTERTKQRLWFFHKKNSRKKRQRQDLWQKRPHSSFNLGSPSFFFCIRIKLLFSIQTSIMTLPYMFKKKKEKKRNQHKPRRHPCCHHRHMSSRAHRPSVCHCALSVCVFTGPSCQWWLQWQRRAHRAPGCGCLGLRPSQLRSPWWRRRSGERPLVSPFSSAGHRPPAIKTQKSNIH